jgi:hypothetical protein
MTEILHVDEKTLIPKDNSSISTADFEKHYNKPVRGHVIVETSDGVIETPNLVLLQGREFLTQQLAQVAGATDLTNYKLRYFGVGEGGADTASQPNKIGPFDNDTNLAGPRKIADVDTSDTSYQYINDGYLKNILSDSGKIEIVEEDHIIIINNQEVEVKAFTTIKYTMYIRSDELYKDNGQNGPMGFNEAALYAVKYDGDKPAKSSTVDDSSYNPNHRCFARFTTMTKWLEQKDSLKITWYILL